MYVMEEVHVLDKLHSGMSYGAVVCELIVDESTIDVKLALHRNM